MIRRLFYFWLGFFTAVWAMRRLRALHPNHLARRAVNTAAGVATAVREFAADVRHLTATREIELRARYGLETVEDKLMLDNPRTAGQGRPRAIESNHDVKDGR